MLSRLTRILFTGSSLLIPLKGYAAGVGLEKLNVSGALNPAGFGDQSVPDIIENIANTLLLTVVPVASALFILGAFLYIVSLEKEERKNQGKEFMIGSLIGVAVVVGAKAIVNTTLYFLYP